MANDRFKMKIWNLKRLKWKPSDGWTFHRGGAFSQWGLIFAAKGCFRSPFHSSFRSFEMGEGEGGGAAKWHSCAKGVFRSGGPISQPTPDFVAGTLWLQNDFAVDGHFRRGLFWAAKFRRPLNFLGSEVLLAP